MPALWVWSTQTQLKRKLPKTASKVLTSSNIYLLPFAVLPYTRKSNEIEEDGITQNRCSATQDVQTNSTCPFLPCSFFAQWNTCVCSGLR